MTDFTKTFSADLLKTVTETMNANRDARKSEPTLAERHARDEAIKKGEINESWDALVGQDLSPQQKREYAQELRRDRLYANIPKSTRTYRPSSDSTDLAGKKTYRPSSDSTDLAGKKTYRPSSDSTDLAGAYRPSSDSTDLAGGKKTYRPSSDSIDMRNEATKRPDAATDPLPEAYYQPEDSYTGMKEKSGIKTVIAMKSNSDKDDSQGLKNEFGGSTKQDSQQQKSVPLSPQQQKSVPLSTGIRDDRATPVPQGRDDRAPSVATPKTSPLKFNNGPDKTSMYIHEPQTPQDYRDGIRRVHKNPNYDPKIVYNATNPNSGPLKNPSLKLHNPKNDELYNLLLNNPKLKFHMKTESIAVRYGLTELNSGGGTVKNAINQSGLSGPAPSIAHSETEFNNKLQSARKAGKENFSHGGKTYSTLMKEAAGVDKRAQDKHNCATHVYDKKLGEGRAIYGQHAEPDFNGDIAWYDVMFESGIERVMTEEVIVIMAEEHGNHKKKIVSEDAHPIEPTGITADATSLETKRRRPKPVAEAAEDGSDPLNNFMSKRKSMPDTAKGLTAKKTSSTLSNFVNRNTSSTPPSTTSAAPRMSTPASTPAPAPKMSTPRADVPGYLASRAMPKLQTGVETLRSKVGIPASLSVPSKVTSLVRGAGKGLSVVGLGTLAYGAYDDYANKNEPATKVASKVAGATAGGVGGAEIGSAIGTGIGLVAAPFLGPETIPIGAWLGGIAGGAIGASTGYGLAGMAYDSTQDEPEKKVTAKPNTSVVTPARTQTMNNVKSNYPSIAKKAVQEEKLNELKVPTDITRIPGLERIPGMEKLIGKGGKDPLDLSPEIARIFGFQPKTEPLTDPLVPGKIEPIVPDTTPSTVPEPAPKKLPELPTAPAITPVEPVPVPQRTMPVEPAPKGPTVPMAPRPVAPRSPTVPVEPVPMPQRTVPVEPAPVPQRTAPEYPQTRPSPVPVYPQTRPTLPIPVLPTTPTIPAPVIPAPVIPAPVIPAPAPVIPAPTPMIPAPAPVYPQTRPAPVYPQTRPAEPFVEPTIRPNYYGDEERRRAYGLDRTTGLVPVAKTQTQIAPDIRTQLPARISDIPREILPKPELGLDAEWGAHSIQTPLTPGAYNPSMDQRDYEQLWANLPSAISRIIPNIGVKNKKQKANKNPLTKKNP